MTQEHSDLLQACKERKYLDIRDRIVAVKMVLVDDCKKSHVAKWFERSRPTIDDWVDRYEKEGIAGLKDRPGRGRKPVISDKMYSYVITRGAVTNPQKVKTEVENRTKQTVSLSTVRRKMRRNGYTRKFFIHKKYANRDSDEEIREFQKCTLPEISRLEEQGYLLLAEDEMHKSTHTKSRAHMWASTGTRIYMTAPVDAKKVTVFGVVGSNGENYYEAAEKANSHTFIEFLRGLKKKYRRKIVMIVDGAPYHNSNMTKKYAEEHNIILVKLPTAVPELNAAEEIWNTLRRELPPDLFIENRDFLEEYVISTLEDLDIDIDVISYLKRKIVTPNN